MTAAHRKHKDDDLLREQVLDVAEEIIVREGLDRVSMRRIARGVDYTQTVLYRLFESKNDLIDHLIARGYEGVREHYRQVGEEPHPDPLHRLRRILEVYIEYALGHPNHYHMWFASGALRREADVLKMCHGRLEFVVFESWLECIDDCRNAELIAATDRIEVFQTIWSWVHGIISLRLHHPSFPWRDANEEIGTLISALHSNSLHHNDEASAKS